METKDDKPVRPSPLIKWKINSRDIYVVHIRNTTKLLLSL